MTTSRIDQSVPVAGPVASRERGPGFFGLIIVLLLLGGLGVAGVVLLRGNFSIADRQVRAKTFRVEYVYGWIVFVHGFRADFGESSAKGCVITRSNDGTLTIAFRPPPPGQIDIALNAPPLRHTPWWSVYSQSTSPNTRIVSVRLWFLIATGSLLLLPFGVAAYRAVQKYQRRRGNRCWKCGYDLTGNTSGVCPECGTRVTR